MICFTSIILQSSSIRSRTVVSTSVRSEMLGVTISTSSVLDILIMSSSGLLMVSSLEILEILIISSSGTTRMCSLLTVTSIAISISMVVVVMMFGVRREIPECASAMSLILFKRDNVCRTSQWKKKVTPPLNPTPAEAYTE